MRPIRWLRRGIMLAGLGAAGGALIVTARHLLETPQPLQSAIPGEGRIDRKHGGDIYYNVAGDESAESLVLLHDFYLGASNYEYRHIFPRLAQDWRVYAPDWLGFGMSEHPPLAYTGEFYANALIGFLRDVVERPAVVMAHGRAANIAARAAADAPDLFSRLVLVSPNVEAGIEIEPKPTQLLIRAAQRASLGLVPYAFLSMKPLLRRLAHSRSAFSGEVSANEATVEHLYASAHQFGGQHAQLALMTGELDLPIQNIFPLLQPPVLLISGDEDPEHPVSVMEDLAVLNPHADLDVLSSAGVAPFADQPAMFTDVLLDWLATTPARQEPQVEERHPSLQADALPSAPPPLTPEISVATEPIAPSDVAAAADATETAEMPGASPTAETPESVLGPDGTPESTPASESAKAPTQKAPRKTSSKPARRASSASLSAPASTPRKRAGSSESGTPGKADPGEAAQRQRTTRAARTKSQSSTTKKTTNSATQRKTGTRKSSRASQDQD